MYELQIQNTNECDPCSYEAIKTVAKKTQKNILDFNGIRTHDLCDTSEMLYQLSYKALLVIGQE